MSENLDQNCNTVFKFAASQMWDDLLIWFKNNLPLKPHRRLLTWHANCFRACDAISFMHDHLACTLQKCVQRDQAFKLLQKYYSGHIFEPVDRVIDEFKDDKTLYRFSNNTKLCWNGLLSSNTGKRPPLGNRNMDSSMPNIHQSTETLKTWNIVKIKRGRSFSQKLSGNNEVSKSSEPNEDNVFNDDDGGVNGGKQSLTDWMSVVKNEVSNNGVFNEDKGSRKLNKTADDALKPHNGCISWCDIKNKQTSNIEADCFFANGKLLKNKNNKENEIKKVSAFSSKIKVFKPRLKQKTTDELVNGDKLMSNLHLNNITKLKHQDSNDKKKHTRNTGLKEGVQKSACEDDGLVIKNPHFNKMTENRKDLSDSVMQRLLSLSNNNRKVINFFNEFKIENKKNVKGKNLQDLNNYIIHNTTIINKNNLPTHIDKRLQIPHIVIQSFKFILENNENDSTNHTITSLLSYTSSASPLVSVHFRNLLTSLYVQEMEKENFKKSRSFTNLIFNTNSNNNKINNTNTIKKNNRNSTTNDKNIGEEENRGVNHFLKMLQHNNKLTNYFSDVYNRNKLNSYSYEEVDGCIDVYAKHDDDGGGRIHGLSKMSNTKENPMFANFNEFAYIDEDEISQNTFKNASKGGEINNLNDEDGVVFESRTSCIVDGKVKTSKLKNLKTFSKNKKPPSYKSTNEQDTSNSTDHVGVSISQSDTFLLRNKKHNEFHVGNKIMEEYEGDSKSSGIQDEISDNAYDRNYLSSSNIGVYRTNVKTFNKKSGKLLSVWDALKSGGDIDELSLGDAMSEEEEDEEEDEMLDDEINFEHITILKKKETMIEMLQHAFLLLEPYQRRAFAILLRLLAKLWKSTNVTLNHKNKILGAFMRMMLDKKECTKGDTASHLFLFIMLHYDLVFKAPNKIYKMAKSYSMNKSKLPEPSFTPVRF